MSLYRMAVRNGLLVREKRKLIRWWCWSFVCSEEDHIIAMKNRLVQLREEQARLTKMIPEHEGRVKDVKDYLMQNGSTGPPFRDKWRPRREPNKLNLDVKLKAPKGDSKSKGKSQPKPLFNITPSQ